MLYLWTAPFDYPGPFRVDVSDRSKCAMAPSNGLLDKLHGWMPIAEQLFAELYAQELDNMRKEGPEAW